MDSNIDDKENEEEYNLLITRASFHQKHVNTEYFSTSTPTINRKHKYKERFLLCAEHVNLNKNCKECLIFPMQDSLPNGRLPTARQVLSYLFYTDDSNIGIHQKNASDVASDIMLHWISCNVYTVSRRSTVKKLNKLVDTYITLKKYPKKKRGHTYSTNLNTFIEVCDAIFDIKCTDPIRLKDQQHRWKVKETEEDLKFYRNQCLIPQDFNGYEEIHRASQYPNIRLFTVQRYASNKPLVELANKHIRQQWSVANKDSVGGGAWQYFSAICWIFGRRLYDTYKVPIGLISSNYGGTPVEAWSSPETLSECGLSNNIEYGPRDSSVLWNGMIYPLLNTTIYGVIWYQGEANAVYPQTYNCTFPALIQGWRREWYDATNGRTDIFFPFGFVQLSALSTPVMSGFPTIRWKQTAEFGYVPNPKQMNTFMAVSMDLIDSKSPYGSIHPRDKTTVAERLFLGARNIAYKEDIYWTGPIFERIELKNDGNESLSVVIHYQKSTLQENDIEVRSDKGFEVSLTSDKNSWIPADITSSTGKAVLLTLRDVSQEMIHGVRYAWNQNPCLYKLCAVYASNSDLPSPPFIAYAPFESDIRMYQFPPIVEIREKKIYDNEM